MLNIFEVNLSYLEEQFSVIDTLFLGCTHAITLAIPFSPPLLICLRRLLVQGALAGFVSYLGTTVGYLVFFTFLFFGARDLVQFWYDWEPIFYSLGLY